MGEVEIRPTQIGDAEALAANLRESDRAELEACGFVDMLTPIAGSVAVSTLCWTATVDGQVACIIGASPLEGSTGSPWMLGTPLLDQHSRVLVRKTPEYIALMLGVFPHLLNYVHAGNTTSVRWLRRLGFTLHAATPYGARGELFHQFEMHA